ncbi:hypothetical protein [Thermoactinospora rubra]|uniref:hypothetical protein n=1 Tax=Thermoactinospora rubra TaxID=1088767 RepID=UPI000A0FC7C0|nr:hypothetical protein [Thermoactinospora rubra]
MERTHWEELPAETRGAIERLAGPITTAATVEEGMNSQIALVALSGFGRIFIKGIRSDDPRARMQRMEAMINPFVRHISPRLLWQTTAGGWELLGFEYAGGEHADYGPGSADLPLVIEVMEELQGMRCPGLPLKTAEQRWAGYVGSSAELEHFRGETLLHTDYNPCNVLVGARATLIDWAWPTRGAAWIDPACWVLRLVAQGQTPAEAESWAGRVGSWREASAEGIDAFARASVRLWDEIAAADPQPWKTGMALAAREWCSYRGSGPPA